MDFNLPVIFRVKCHLNHPLSPHFILTSKKLITGPFVFQAELRTKFVSLAPSHEDPRSSSKKILGMPGSPNKIKNIAAMFEQKT